MADSSWATISQAAERVPWLTARYARRLIYERRVEYSRVGGKILINLEDLERLVDEGRVAPEIRATAGGSPLSCSLIRSKQPSIVRAQGARQRIGDKPTRKNAP